MHSAAIGSKGANYIESDDKYDEYYEKEVDWQYAGTLDLIETVTIKKSDIDKGVIYTNKYLFKNNQFVKISGSE
ncbi:MAG: hypothetical protein LBC09_05015 [Helicobacteraceae bacterium]|nr:hypothetical protein [Helicobacteraceae bacterium]